MIHVNPFCDSDFRNGLQSLAGINLIFLVISVIIDILAIVEVSVFSKYCWEVVDLKCAACSGVIVLGLHIFILFIQLLYGCKLMRGASENDYIKCRQWYYPSMLLYGMELLDIFIYVIFFPSSVYFYYFVSISLVYKVYLFWPVKRYLEDDDGLGVVTERTRLLGCVN